MPLPAEDTPWPPDRHKRPYMAFQEWSAWYSGDPTYLADVYGSIPDVERPRRWMFWTRKGVDSAREQGRVKIHVPIASDMAQLSADLLFSEAPKLTSTDPETTARLAVLVDEGGVHNKLLEAAEIAAGVGGVYLRAAWDEDTADHALSAIVGPEQADPDFSFGQLVGVTFWQVLSEDSDKKILRHVERHDRGLITHALYMGTADKIGYSVPLGRHPVTEVLATANSVDPSELQVVVQLPIPKLAAAYVPNVRPGRRLRNTDHGRSDFDGSEGLMDALDETYSSWMRDVRLAKARLLVPESFLERQTVNGAAGFDLDNEVFTPLDVDPTQTQGIDQVQFQIRVAEHRETAVELIDRIISNAGYSPQSFGLHIEGRAESGTALRVRERRSLMTQARKQRYFKPAILDHMQMLLAIEASIFGRQVAVERPMLEWSDQTAPDPKEIAETAQLLRNAEAASTDTLVRMVHPDWDDEQVAAEVALISRQSPMAVPNLFDSEANGMDRTGDQAELPFGPFDEGPDDDEDEDEDEDSAER